MGFWTQLEITSPAIFDIKFIFLDSTLIYKGLIWIDSFNPLSDLKPYLRSLNLSAKVLHFSRTSTSLCMRASRIKQYELCSKFRISGVGEKGWNMEETLLSVLEITKSSIFSELPASVSYKCKSFLVTIFPWATCLNKEYVAVTWRRIC